MYSFEDVILVVYYSLQSLPQLQYLHQKVWRELCTSSSVTERTCCRVQLPFGRVPHRRCGGRSSARLCFLRYLPALCSALCLCSGASGSLLYLHFISLKFPFLTLQRITSALYNPAPRETKSSFKLEYFWVNFGLLFNWLLQNLSPRSGLWYLVVAPYE